MTIITSIRNVPLMMPSCVVQRRSKQQADAYQRSLHVEKMVDVLIFSPTAPQELALSKIVPHTSSESNALIAPARRRRQQ